MSKPHIIDDFINSIENNPDIKGQDKAIMLKNLARIKNTNRARSHLS